LKTFQTSALGVRFRG